MTEFWRAHEERRQDEAAMDYFDFEEAAQTFPDFDLDECSSTVPQANEAEAQESYESLFFDKTAALHHDNPQPAPMMLTLMNNTQIEVIPHQDDFGATYPMFRARDPCDFCKRKGMDCFLAQRGALIMGCTCCISLFRECSFTHQKAPKGVFSTFPGISEDSMVCEGSIEKRIAAMRSFTDDRPRKNGARFSRDSVKTLKAWLADHADHPYPNDREKDELKQVTRLKRSQISNWLANARRRGKVRPSSEPSSPVMGAIDIPCKPKDSNGVDTSEMTPFDRWKISPPEHEAASVTAIAKAVASARYPARNGSSSSLNNSRGNSRPGSRGGSSRRTSSEDDSGFSMFRAPSVSSLGTHQSSTSDFSRVSKGSTKGSRGSLASSIGDRRRRKRAPMTQRAAAQNAKSRGARIFQCTFCTDTFPAKYDWQRHEKSLHLALERWTCCPSGGTFTVPASNCKHCVFCQLENPTASHLESHNFSVCQEKTLQERTFYRKDHLRQHLKLLHSAKFSPKMESWKSTTTEVKSRCGFCPSVFSTWQQRADHLAAHFRNGSDMSQWAGGWGFEPYVARLVEDAMPPYMIAQERASMDPFVAKDRSHGKTTPAASSSTDLTFGSSAPAEDESQYQIASDSNCWGRLDNELTRYILASKMAGVVPSDQDLQNKARMIIYDDDDPWNQTPADNKLWLDTLKYQTGIAAAAPVERLEEVPIMPPYVVRGGLRNPRASVGGVSAKRSGSGDGSGVVTPGLPMVEFGEGLEMEMEMELDFSQIDFNEMDLGMVDESGFVAGRSLDGGGLMDDFLQQPQMQSLGFVFEDSLGGGEMKGMAQEGFDMNLMQSQNLGMSAQDMEHLAGYMTGFH
jgi:hypothetical protein